MVQPELGEQLTEQIEKEGFFNRIAPFVRRPEVTIPGLAIASAGLALVASSPAFASEQAPDSGYTIVGAHDQLTGSLVADSFTTPARLLPTSAKTVAREMQHSERDWAKVKRDNKKERKVCTTDNKAILQTPSWICSETRNDPTFRRSVGINMVLITKSPTIVEDLRYLSRQGIALPSVKDIWYCQRDVLDMSEKEGRPWVYLMTGGPACSEVRLSVAPKRVKDSAYKHGIRW